MFNNKHHEPCFTCGEDQMGSASFADNELEAVARKLLGYTGVAPLASASPSISEAMEADIRKLISQVHEIGRAAGFSNGRRVGQEETERKYYKKLTGWDRYQQWLKNQGGGAGEYVPEHEHIQSPSGCGTTGGVKR
jgi:hypothetical protein